VEMRDLPPVLPLAPPPPVLETVLSTDSAELAAHPRPDSTLRTKPVFLSALPIAIKSVPICGGLERRWKSRIF